MSYGQSFEGREVDPHISKQATKLAVVVMIANIIRYTYIRSQIS